jgi:hypothetical protein
MATYIPNATDATEPVNSRPAGSAAEEFRTLKGSVNNRFAKTLSVPEASVGALPNVATRANKLLGFDASGDPAAVAPSPSGVFSVSAVAPLSSSGGSNPTITFTGILGVANGGTGTSSTAFCNLSSNVTGTLPVANGGTGQSSLTANNVLLGNGTSGVQTVAPGASGNVLTSNGSTWTSAPAGASAVTSVNGLTGAVSMTGLGDIGSYAVLIIATNTNVAVGSTVAGSDLRYGWTPNTGAVAASTNGYSAYSANRSNGSASYNGGGTSLSGTWRKMSTGATYGTITGGCCSTVYYWMAALYVRIS